ncbi:MAG: hypothetical protein RLZZ621_381 [Gemmatimonadota bacterium]
MRGAIRHAALLGLTMLLAAPSIAVAQSAKGADPIESEGYVTPPEAITRLVTAPRERNTSFTTPSPGTRRYFARTVSDGLPTLQRVGKAHHNLGGLQIDQAANRERTLTMRSSAGLEITEWATGRVTRVALPAGARAGAPVWSPDGTRFAFYALFDDATQLFMVDAATGKATAMTPRTVLATTVTAPEWTGDGAALVTVLVPTGRGAEPREPALAAGPMVRTNEGTKLKTRTYADLVMTPYEKSLLTYHITGQLAVVDARTRTVRTVGAPAMIRSVEPSPDAQYLRVTVVEPPFSYALPVSAFGTREILLDAKGTIVRELARRPMRESDDPVDAGAGARGRTPAIDTSRRFMAWHPTKTALVYAQVGPANARGGNADTSANRRPDRVMQWAAPFDTTGGATVYQTTNRITAFRFNEAGTILFVTEAGTGGTFEQAIFLAENNAKFTVIAPRRGARDSSSAPAAGAFGRGANAGGLVTRMGRSGVPVVMVSTDGKFVFTQGASPDSVKTPTVFIEKIEIRTGTRTRIYESGTEWVETISAALDDDFSQAVIQRESATTVSQSFVLTVASKAVKQLTNNVDVMPELTKAVRKTVVARRADGFAFNVKVTLPADYQTGTRLPAMFWFYPREYDNQAAYDRSLTQAAAAERRFPSYGPRSLAFLVTQGYAVVEPDAPIFASEGQLPNDNYVVDLRNNLAAVIDALDTLAIIDRHRLGLGGHSYGAFSTVNAMVHTPYFKAGIAGDGAYNRTLTPNGFQSERRDLWQGRQTYLDMSPLLYADQLNGALLLYHSTEDQNVGTDPINSTRLYHALMGLGKTTSLYMYPYEDHGPIAKETVLDQWARWVAWLDKYVKNANKPKVAM